MRGFLSALPLSLVLCLGLYPTAVAAQDKSKPDQPGELAEAEQKGDREFRLHALLTDSPRQTLATFARLRQELEDSFAAYRRQQNAENGERLSLVSSQLRSLIDLSQVPASARGEVGIETMAYILDILGRIGLPELDQVPDYAALGSEGPATYRIRGTPLKLVRIEAGPREGEYLFSGRSVRTAPEFYRGIRALPLESGLPIRSWHAAYLGLTGTLIPLSFSDSLPAWSRRTVFGTPAWKVILLAVMVFLGAVLLFLWHRFLRRLWASRPPLTWTARIIEPVSVLCFVYILFYVIDVHVNLAGYLSIVVSPIEDFLVFLIFSWIFWVVIRSVAELIVASPRIPSKSLDENLARLVSRMIAVVGVILIVAIGAQQVGLPVLSLLAGLGIGGLAIALAARPTLENLIGGFILYLDKPIRVGDFCTFGSQSGTIESIGVRSTQIRALDRTLITIPNAQFADMQIVNWAQCDQMLINQTIGLRYETDPDQLRFVLAKIREMFHGHPRIDNDTVRVRFAGHGASSLDIDIRVYAKTREWNDFFAIKEDVFLRITDIVNRSGTGFAFPSQTLYMARDGGLDSELSATAKREVSAWRRSWQLPFPRFSAGQRTKIDDTLHYPPEGSPDYDSTDEVSGEGSERLSVGSDVDDGAAEPVGDMTGEEDKEK